MFRKVILILALSALLATFRYLAQTPSRRCPELRGVFSVEGLSCSISIDESGLFELAPAGVLPYWLEISEGEIHATWDAARVEVPWTARISQQIEHCDTPENPGANQALAGLIQIDRVLIGNGARRAISRFPLHWRSPPGADLARTQSLPQELNLEDLSKSFHSAQPFSFRSSGRLYIRTDIRIDQNDGRTGDCILRLQRLSIPRRSQL